MNAQIEDELNGLRRAEMGGDLDQLEQAVWGRISAARARRSATAAFLPASLLSVAAALAIGLAGGGMAAMGAHDHQGSAAFAIDTHLAPSTLLGGRG